MPTLAELRALDTLSLDPAAITRGRGEMVELVEGGSLSARDEAAGMVQSIVKATHLLGQNHGIRLSQDPYAGMFGVPPGIDDEMDLGQVNDNLGAVGAEGGSLEELTPWTMAYLIVDIVTLVFGELTDDLPTL